MYRHYNQAMTGQRVATTASGDKKLDVYATLGNDALRMLVGVRLATGTWQLRVENLSVLGLPPSGTVRIRTTEFLFTGGHYGRVDGTKDLGVVDHNYSGDAVTFPIYSRDLVTTWAF